MARCAKDQPSTRCLPAVSPHLRLEICPCSAPFSADVLRWFSPCSFRSFTHRFVYSLLIMDGSCIRVFLLVHWRPLSPSPSRFSSLSRRHHQSQLYASPRQRHCCRVFAIGFRPLHHQMRKVHCQPIGDIIFVCLFIFC